MANPFGANNHPLYDLSRILSVATAAPSNNLLDAPIILVNPAITSGVALFSHTPQPFSASVTPANELSLINLDFANTAAAGSGAQFYGIKIKTNTDNVDTGAGMAVFNVGKSDNIYLGVAGKSGAGPFAGGNSPTGIGIDLNKQVASVNENSTSSSQQGIQIWDHSTTDQGTGGPRALFLWKYANMNTDHILATIFANRNALQVLVDGGNAGYDATKPVIRFDDQDTSSSWWVVRASGEQIFNKDGIGIQWITPGAKTAYILSSTNDLKLKSGGTGIRFVNQADTQTIVMMQDDLSVDIPNNETRFQALKIVSDRIENTITNALAAVSMNYNGYNGGTTQFRDFKIFDGKQGVVAIFTGTNKNFLLGTATDKATGNPHAFFSNSGAIAQPSSASMYIMSNAWDSGASRKRLSATNGAALLEMYNITPAINFYFPTDAGNTVDSTITFALYHNFQKDSAQIGLVSSPGKVYLNSMIFGSMYADDIAQTITVGAANTEVKITAGISGGTCNGFTFQNSRELKCADSGTYEVVWGMSISSGTNNENLSGGVVINTVTWQHNTEGSCNQNNSNNAVHVGGAGVITLAANDTVGLFVENESAGHDITVRHANLVVKRIGA